MSNGSWRTRLHRVADRVDGRWRPALRRLPRVERAWIALLDSIVSLQSDRSHLRSAILPVIARAGPARLLFVGVRAPDPEALRAIRLFEPAAPFGLPHRKRFADVTHVYAWYRARDYPV